MPITAGRTARKAIAYPTAAAHLAAVAAGAPLITFRTAPLPAGVLPEPFDVCGCTYQPPTVDGRVVPHRLDPAWSFTEDPPRTGSPVRSLRWIVQRMVWGATLNKRWFPPLYPLPGFHSGDPRYEKPGFPDFIAWPPGQPLAWELKRMGKVPELAQATHLTSMRRAGWAVGLRRPCCLLSGRISRELAAAAGTGLHPHDEYARYVVRALPDTGPAPRAPRRATTGGSGPAPAGAPVADLVAELCAGGTTGYAINVGGTCTAAQGADIALVRFWLRDRGIPMMATTNPMRLIVDGDQVHVAVRGTARWQRVPADRLPLDVIDRLAHDRGTVVTASTADRVKQILTQRDGV